MAKKQGITDRLRRSAEADFFKLFGGVSPTPSRDRALLDQLLGQGTTARSSARVLCATHSPLDPRRCAEEIPQEPRGSAARTRTGVFEAEPVWIGTKSIRLGTTRAELPPHPVKVDLGVAWDVEREVNPFLLVVGGSGSGKTELLKRLAAEASRSVPVVLFDVHGDLAVPGFTDHHLGKLGLNPLALLTDSDNPAREFAETIQRAANLGKVQAYELAEILAPILRSKRAGLSDVLQELRRLKEQGKQAEQRRALGLLASVDTLFGERVFHASPSFDPALLARRGGSRLNLTALSRAAQVVAIDGLLRYLFGQFKAAGPVPRKGVRMVVLIDEASLVQGSPVVERVFREARKFGLGLVLASQLAADFDSTIRANAGALVALRSSSSKDRSANAKELGVPVTLLEGLDRPGAALYRGADGVRQFQALRVGERSDGLSASAVAAGTKVETEHTPDKAIAEAIAVDHLKEDSSYYRIPEKRKKTSIRKEDIGSQLAFSKAISFENVHISGARTFNNETTLDIHQAWSYFPRVSWAFQFDPTRSHLDGIWSGGNHYLWASNGHVLAIVKTPFTIPDMRFGRTFLRTLAKHHRNASRIYVKNQQTARNSVEVQINNLKLKLNASKDEAERNMLHEQTMQLFEKLKGLDDVILVDGKEAPLYDGLRDVDYLTPPPVEQLISTRTLNQLRISRFGVFKILDSIFGWFRERRVSERDLSLRLTIAPAPQKGRALLWLEANVTSDGRKSLEKALPNVSIDDQIDKNRSRFISQIEADAEITHTEPAKVMINYRYFVDAKSTFSTDSLILQYSGELDPIRLLSADAMAIIMPMRL